ncbi:uncharacterized protein LOC105248288 [Camponotus floridanus]|uniref:uncharacterized protein LOC105248288 n=1 Tax=Camponotus floridanus TaxID=104421 RepID=UPI00059CF2DF|nr:uncharacterized protein LOC105248288 [Camponotus floridanus]
MEGVRVGRPERTADLRLHNLDDAATTEEVATNLARVTANFRVGPLRRASNGLNAVWVRCPLRLAQTLAKEGTVVRIGWTRVRVEVLEPRPTQCYRCLEMGHVRVQCKVDRSALCYRCGGPGHIAGGCVADPRCPPQREKRKRPVRKEGEEETSPISEANRGPKEREEELSQPEQHQEPQPDPAPETETEDTVVMETASGDAAPSS